MHLDENRSSPITGYEQAGTLGDRLDYLGSILQEGHPPPPSHAHFGPLLPKLVSKTSGSLQGWFSDLGLFLDRYLCGSHSHIAKSLLKHSQLELDKRCLHFTKAEGQGRSGVGTELPTPLSARKPGGI